MPANDTAKIKFFLLRGDEAESGFSCADHRYCDFIPAKFCQGVDRFVLLEAFDFELPVTEGLHRNHLLEVKLRDFK